MKTKLIAFLTLLTCSLFAGDFLAYPLSPHSSIAKGIGNPCPGTNWSYLNYIVTNPPVQWGYSVDTNATSWSFTDTNRTDTHVMAAGFFGDPHCANSNTYVFPSKPISPKYRFTVYFTNTNNLPVGTNYPILLHGFVQP